MLPDTDEVIAELVRLRDAAEAGTDDSITFLGGELRIAVYSLVQGHDAIARGEIIGALHYLRLLSETTIRVRWMGGDEDVADDRGRPIADMATIRSRASSLQKRDLKMLAAAQRAIAEIGHGDPDLSDALVAMADAIDGAEAPWSIKSLATSKSGLSAYAGHRLCSALIHPGRAMRRGTLMPRDRIGAMLAEVGFLCAAWGDAALRASHAQ